MKYCLIALSLFCFLQLLPAQGTDFAPVGAKWYYDELNFALNWIPYTITAEAKINYQGKWCSKLVPSSVGSINYPAAYVYTQNDTVFYYSQWSHQFEMLYDFTAEPGDSWVVGGLESNIPGQLQPYASDTISVDSVGSMVLNGETLKVWYIHNTFWFDWGNRIIEKAGNDGLFLPKFGLFDVEIWGLRCAETPTQTYHFVNYDCDAVFPYSATHSPEFHPVQIAPNPSSGVARISVPETLQGRWTLFNLQGQQVKSGAWEGDSMDLNLENLENGVYVFCLLREDGVAFTERVQVVSGD